MREDFGEGAHGDGIEEQFLIDDPVKGLPGVIFLAGLVLVTQGVAHLDGALPEVGVELLDEELALQGIKGHLLAFDLVIVGEQIGGLH